MPWFVAPIVTAASPVRTPARASMPGPSDFTASTRSRRRSDCSLGVVLVGRRCAPDRHDGVADELLDRAAIAVDDVARELEVATQELAGVLGVAALGQGGEARRDRRTGSRRGGARQLDTGFGRDPGALREAGAADAAAAPHSPQNLALELSAAPHEAQVVPSREPHSSQNLTPGGLSDPQIEQFTGFLGTVDQIAGYNGPHFDGIQAGRMSPRAVL